MIWSSGIPTPLCGHALVVHHPGYPAEARLVVEQEVLQHVARGLANKEIAEVIERLGETVQAHLERIFQKLGANDRMHAVTIALQRGIIRLDG